MSVSLPCQKGAGVILRERLRNMGALSHRMESTLSQNLSGRACGDGSILRPSQEFIFLLESSRLLMINWNLGFS